MTDPNRRSGRRRLPPNLGGWRLLLVAGVLLVAAIVGAGEIVNRLEQPTPSAPTPAPTGLTTPATSPEATPTTAPTADPSPTGPAVPALLERTWVEADLFGVAYAAVRTSDGWVAVGINCAGGCDSYDATAFTSPDGLTWTEHQIEHAQILPLDVVQVGDHLVAVGREFADRADGTQGVDVVIWESATGTTWERDVTMDLGTCDDVTCLDVQSLSATEDGVLVLATIDRRGGVGGVLRSKNSGPWTEVEPSAFGSADPRFRVIEAMATGSTSILAGACLGCPVSVWSSDDGLDWTLLGEAGFPTPSHIDMASDGTRLVLAHETCVVPSEDGDEVCTMLLWAGELGGPFEQVAADIQVRRPRLAVVDGVFVLAGTSGVVGRVYASTDGLTWAEQPNSMELNFCTLSDLATAGNEILLLTDADCAMAWLGRAR